MGGPNNESAFALTQKSWADFTALNSLPNADGHVSGKLNPHAEDAAVDIQVTSKSDQILFLIRAEVTRSRDGEELLPITYKNNYRTLFAGESRVIRARFSKAAWAGPKLYLQLKGYSVKKQTAAIE